MSHNIIRGVCVVEFNYFGVTIGYSLLLIDLAIIYK